MKYLIRCMFVLIPGLLATAPGFADLKGGTSLTDLASCAQFVGEKPVGTVSRAEGDIHPFGNPHYYADPKNLETLAGHLAEVFSGLDPANAADYAANAKAFNDKMDASLAKWEREMAPYKGASVVTYHPNFVYFADRFGLKLFGTVEPKPGIPPSPHYVNGLAEAMKKAGVKVVLYQPYYNADASNQGAKRDGGCAMPVTDEV